MTDQKQQLIISDEEEEDPSTWTLERAKQKATRTGVYVKVEELKVGDVFNAYAGKHSMLKRLYTVKKITESNVMTTECRHEKFNYDSSGGDTHTYNKFVSKELPPREAEWHDWAEHNRSLSRRFKKNKKIGSNKVFRYDQTKPIFIKVYETDVWR
jgi:hypothetical protein